MIADGVHKRAEALGLAQAAIFPQYREDAGECFLAHVFNRLRGLESRAKF
jgi:hypothetical protein